MSFYVENCPRCGCSTGFVGTLRDKASERRAEEKRECVNCLAVVTVELTLDDSGNVMHRAIKSVHHSSEREGPKHKPFVTFADLDAAKRDDRPVVVGGRSFGSYSAAAKFYDDLHDDEGGAVTFYGFDLRKLVPGARTARKIAAFALLGLATLSGVAAIWYRAWAPEDFWSESVLTAILGVVVFSLAGAVAHPDVS